MCIKTTDLFRSLQYFVNTAIFIRETDKAITDKELLFRPTVQTQRF